MVETEITGSSNIKRVGWADDVLYVTFLKGATYKYVGPTLADYEALVSASSVGSHLHKAILSRFTGQPL